MEAKYKTLHAIYLIVKDDRDPTTYPCSYRELILKNYLDTHILLEHLEALSIEGLVNLKKLERMVICITGKGIDKIKSIAFTNKHS